MLEKKRRTTKPFLSVNHGFLGLTINIALSQIVETVSHQNEEVKNLVILLDSFTAYKNLVGIIPATPDRRLQTTP